MPHRPEDWWKKGVVYQIYPRSFMDSDGDGVGDLAGIESRLDHVVQLGVDAIWISPFYPSPMADFGYDVSDYCDVDPLFGDLAAFDRMLEAAHRRGLKVLLDMVPSHTSEQHPWFVESRQSRHNPKRDWYVWSDPAPDGGPPNNWISEFGGPTWTFDAATGQYYLHIFLSQQPSLNWRNPEVREAVLGAMRFWFDRGVDGFRVDAIENLVPDAQLRDNPPNPAWLESMGPARSLLGIHTQHRPEVFEYVAEMRRVARDYEPERLLIGEAYGTLEQILAYYGKRSDGFHLPFNFQLIGAEWSPRNIAGIVDAYEAALPPGAWPNWVLSNHDRSRFASRVGQAQARVAAMMLLTLRGTPTIYQGEELGMENVPIPPERVMDPWEKNVPGISLGRDPVRTPIAWTHGPGAGFTTGEPWLPIDTRPQMQVDVQAAEEGSMLSLYRRLLELRRREDALSLGDYRTVHVDENVFCYERSHGGRRLVIALNFSQSHQPLPIAGETLLTTLDETARLENTVLAPNEGRILEVR
ncbi:MAG: alpha-amylase family glycosyl hydrolase [Mesorhizobium sp.]|nr:alpha-amylase family glycosyl hydrolase [Mesorhizobium sp.]